MSKTYRAEARERLKNCVGARLSTEALVIALAGGRIGQSDWSVECDRIISLLDDDSDYRRGFQDGLKANTRAAFAAAKQAISERTCEAKLCCDGFYRCTECGHSMLPSSNYCSNCGAKVVE